MKPSEHIAAGECPFCHGAGKIEVLVPVEHMHICPLCKGTKKWPPPAFKPLTGDCEVDCQERCAYPGQFSECDLGSQP